jgi:peptidoglycan/xylan/chitin deacetylase (PgdA/CDA1 family)
MGLPVVDLDSFLHGQSNGAPLSVIITFDDGYASDLTRAANALLNAKFPATFFLSTARMGQPGMMTEDQAKELSKLPDLKIGAHGATHRFLTSLTDDELSAELRGARQSIYEWSGKENIHLSAPGGRISSNVREKVISEGYSGLLTSNPGAYIKGEDPFWVPRLPVTCRTSTEQLQHLLNPDSLSFRLNKWSRVARRMVRDAISGSSPLGKKS